MKFNKEYFAVPETFDLLKNFDHCKTLHAIQVQGNCASSWAIAACQCYADSLCIHLNQSITPSAQYQLNCDKTCIEEPKKLLCNSGCNGGTILAAAQWISEYGITEDSCVPYVGKDRECSIFCRNGKLMKPENGLCSFVETEASVMKMKKALIEHGSLLVGLAVYEDLLTFSFSSNDTNDINVYTHQKGEYRGYTAVKIVGWNKTKDGSEYWIVQNSWGAKWGVNGRNNLFERKKVRKQRFISFVPPNVN
ncbi:putative cathepsin B11 cysteine protease [Monocercomonoides exilis]|uniref:putative cathepsin B11 cysteine protease n=1 Tax=Monocercomonoides exilis TaxID=2049356 RepID=UPI00355A1BEE|nr:putative cathepsin B11 cysteine protease [Monocercomonoides exilis]